MPRKPKKAVILNGKSSATRATTRLLLGVCPKMGCGVKVRLAKKWIDRNLVPLCGCGAGQFLMQTRDFD